jgi:hypothetical protein
MGEGEKPIEACSQVDVSQTHDVSLSSTKDCSGRASEVGEGQGREEEVISF